MLERLQGALRESETSEARLRRFVADAGHELRTPLTTIQGFAELALRHEQQSAEGRREANRLIAQNAERMSLLVDDLQLLAQLDQEPSYRREPVDLLSLAADAVSAAALGSRGRPIGLDPLCTGDELEVVETLGDPHRLRQVVENPLSNARTHTPAGTPVHVRVGTGLVGPDTGGVDGPGGTGASPPLPYGTAVGVLEIVDEGLGWPPRMPSASSSASTGRTRPDPDPDPGPSPGRAARAAAGSGSPSPPRSLKGTVAVWNWTPRRGRAVRSGCCSRGPELVGRARVMMAGDQSRGHGGRT